MDMHRRYRHPTGRLWVVAADPDGRRDVVRILPLEAALKDKGSFITARRRSLQAAILVSFCVLPLVTRSQAAAAQTSSRRVRVG